MTNDLLALSEWRAAAGCTHVARESSGVFWQPIDHLLEDRFAVRVVNAAQSKAVAGRKTAGRDAEWSADPARAMACYGPAFFPTVPSGSGVRSRATARR
jgi:hypothetical protein